jgi:histone H3/H4
VFDTTSNSYKSKRKSAGPQKKIVNFTYALKEIKRLQSTTHSLIPRAPFLRLVKETIQKRTGGTSFRVTETAVEALREASENLLTNIFEDSYLLSLHARRVTLMPRDMQLLMRLKHADFFSPEDQS